MGNDGDIAGLSMIRGAEGWNLNESRKWPFERAIDCHLLRPILIPSFQDYPHILDCANIRVYRRILTRSIRVPVWCKFL